MAEVLFPDVNHQPLGFFLNYFCSDHLLLLGSQPLESTWYGRVCGPEWVSAVKSGFLLWLIRVGSPNLGWLCSSHSRKRFNSEPSLTSGGRGPTAIARLRRGGSTFSAFKSNSVFFGMQWMPVIVSWLVYLGHLLSASGCNLDNLFPLFLCYLVARLMQRNLYA